jgi:hypothetical protein
MFGRSIAPGGMVAGRAAEIHNRPGRKEAMRSQDRRLFGPVFFTQAGFVAQAGARGGA